MKTAIDRQTEQPAKDWSDLGAAVLRAARRAMAIHLVEVAALKGGRFDGQDAAISEGGQS